MPSITILLPASLLCGVLLSLHSLAAESLSFPLPVDQSASTTARQLAQPVLRTRLLDDMENSNTWKGFGLGEVRFTNDRHRDGSQSIRLTSPTRGSRPPQVQGRPFGESGIRREFADENWTDFNRLSIWVYPDLPGFKTVSLLLKLQSEGTAGRSYTDGGMHFVLLRNQQWNQVVWEIPHLDRAHVRSVEFIYRLQGNEPGATNRVTYDFDHLELQKVVPCTFEGWQTPPDQFAYAHTGYAPQQTKVALASAAGLQEFEVVSASTGARVWRGGPVAAETPSGPVTVLDFTAFKRTGEYRLKAGALQTEPFRIGEMPWRDSLVGGLNFFFCERCGYAVPGIHDVCHEDWLVSHGGRTRPINGGWHDAGDLSQGLVNTSEAAWSMLRLSAAVEKSDPELARRFLHEARWGLEWLLKTRFGDGFRVTWATMDFWTDGVRGNVDDVTVNAGNGAFENFLAAAAEAVGARSWQKLDPAFAVSCRDAAESDFASAVTRMRDPNVEVSAAACQAAIELFRLTTRDDYRQQARQFAEVLVASQETAKPGWDIPLTGYFYTNPRRERLLHYNHRSHEQAPVVALADALETFANDSNAAAWRETIARYGNYLLEASKLTGPYRMIPAGIYRVKDTSDAAQLKQVTEGIRLAEGVYLRRFPVWGEFRGNLGVLLSQANAAATAGRVLRSRPLRRLAEEQLEWTLGRNPFCQSLMYGVGHNYAPQYTAMSGDMTGSLPVGIQSRLHHDEPYWPPSNCYNYAEVWVHPVSRWFSLVAQLSQP